MAEGIQVGKWYDPDTDEWFVVYKFSAKEYDNLEQEAQGFMEEK